MYLQNQGWSRNSEIPKHMTFSRQMKTRNVKKEVLVRCWDHGYKASVTGQIKFRLKFFHLQSQHCCDTFLSSGPPNVGSQDLVSYSSCNCDITAFSARKRRRTRRKKKGFSGSVPTIFVWDCRLILSFFCLLALINSWIISARRQRKLRINLAEKTLTSN